ncbi:galactokinase [Cellulophaga baltica]|uniref:galactokinase n=1 Tax=Cellulophaga TaxID=104264 RepID=UPI001C073D6B|nr:MULTISPECIES: galactokinase [Cellulophaga]MBU2997274.1 galactokinase [Cellulophaga baltica]MDO6768672.1 galactokinase [Cellulophaga sp. 1_MG-2023]
MDKKLIVKVQEDFQERFTNEPILIFSPGRINLIGEHTDYNDGFVFPAAINKGIYLAIQKSDNGSCQVFANDMNELYEFNLNSISTIQNGNWRNYILGVVAEIIKKGFKLGNFDILFSGDIPSGAGLSSSAALENSVVYALNELYNLQLSKKEMILISQKAEHNYAAVKCGIMDQYASMFGVENSALLLDCRYIDSSTFEIDFKEYELLLINSNVKHELAESAYNDRRQVCENVAQILNVDALRDATIEDLNRIKNKLSEEDYQKALYIIEENNRVQLFSKAIAKRDLNTLGELLYQSHKGLSLQYKVSCKELDYLVDKTKGNNNILGARMMGGGFGGCTINLILNTEIPLFKSYIADAFKNVFEKDCSFYSVKLSKGTHLINL